MLELLYEFQKHIELLMYKDFSHNIIKRYNCSECNCQISVNPPEATLLIHAGHCSLYKLFVKTLDMIDDIENVENEEWRLP